MSKRATPADSTTQRETRFSSEQLLLMEFPSPDWLVPEFVPIGFSILAGRPKIGKSWLCLQLANAVAAGGEFLGKQVEQGSVLYFALEDNPPRLHKRLRRQGGQSSQMLEFEIMHWPGWKDVEREIAECSYRLVIVDTLSRALGDWDQNDVAATTRVLDGLQKTALKYEMAVIGVDHHRKGAGPSQDLENVLGSTAEGAVADAILQLYHESKRRETILQISGRDIEEEYELAVSLDRQTCCWELLGAANQPKIGTVNSLVTRAISDLVEESHLPTTNRIAQKLKRDAGQISRSLADLEDQGIVFRGEKKGKEQPYYQMGSLVNNINSQSSTEND